MRRTKFAVVPPRSRLWVTRSTRKGNGDPPSLSAEFRTWPADGPHASCHALALIVFGRHSENTLSGKLFRYGFARLPMWKVVRPRGCWKSFRSGARAFSRAIDSLEIRIEGEPTFFHFISWNGSTTTFLAMQSAKDGSTHSSFTLCARPAPNGCGHTGSTASANGRRSGRVPIPRSKNGLKRPRSGNRSRRRYSLGQGTQRAGRARFL